MRLNLFFAFIISTFLSIRIADAISLFRPQDAYWIYIIPAIFLILTIIYKKVGFLKKTTSKVFLALSISIPCFVFIFFIFLCLLNYPPEGAFEAKLKPEVVTEQEINAGNQLIKKLDEFKKKLDTSDQDLVSEFDITDSNKSKIIELLNKTSVDRNEIFEYINKNSIAIPKFFGKTRKLNSLSDGLGNYEVHITTLLAIFKMELFEVEILKMEQKYDESVNKYILSWHKFVDANKIKNTSLNDFLCFITITKDLGEYYYNNQSTFISYDLSEVANLKEDIIDNLDRTYKVGFTNEYILHKSMFENSKNIWPLMDRNRHLRKLDGFLYSIIEYEKNPLDVVLYEEPVDFGSLENPIFFKDYIGEFLYAITTSMFSGVSENSLKKKNELSVFFYAMDKNNYQNIPKDYFTGEKMKASEFPDRIEIDVQTNIELDSPKKYVIIK